jgi:murein DD-endopeptidase MepM/ murein hydrolase activator NlpD
LKRAYPQKLKPVEASEIEKDGLAEPSKQQTIESAATASSGRVRSLATLGLAISVVANGILLPRSGDSARATEPAPPAESTASVQPASANVAAANSARVDGAAAELAAATSANGIAPEAVLEVGQPLNIAPTSGISSLEPADSTQAAAPAAAIDPEQKLNLNGSEPLSLPAVSGFEATAGIAPGTAARSPNSTVEPNGIGAINSLKKQENRATAAPPAQVGFEEPASSSKSAAPVELSGQDRASSTSATNTAIPDLSATPVIPGAQIDARNAGVQPSAAAAPPFESIEQSLATPSLPPAVVVPPAQNATAQPTVLYSVRPGDTLSAIAKGHGVSAQELIAANKLGDPNFLNINQRLKIPKKIGSHNSAVRAAASSSASNSTSVPSAAAWPGVLLPGSSGPEVANSGVASPAPTASVVSPLANVEGLNNISAPIVPKINSIPLSQISQSMSDSGRLELQGEPTFTGAVDTSALPVGAGATAPNSAAGEYSGPANVTPRSGVPGLGAEATAAAADRARAQLPVGEASRELQPAQAVNPYAERLRAEIVRLRSEYRAERSSIGANSVPPSAVSEPFAQVAAGNPSENIHNLNPDGRAQDYAQAVQNEISSPVSRQWEQQVNRQQQERFDPMRAAELQPINLTPISALEQPVVATAPLGSQGYDPLSNPSLERMVSPELPPLSGADTYLPDGGKQQSADGLIWPAKGVLTSGYGWRWGRMHRGIDIAGPIGTPIVAASDGVVTYAEWNDGGYGYLVEITHPDGTETIYAHNSRILVQKGQKVAQGEQISEMGSTGFSTGPHLHFEIHPAGQGAVNPMAFLPDDASRASR